MEGGIVQHIAIDQRYQYKYVGGMLQALRMGV